MFPMVAAKMRSMLILLLAIAWVPLTSHCLLEDLPGFEFLRCAAESHDAHGGHDQTEGSRHCDDACCAVEASDYLPADSLFDLAEISWAALSPEWLPADAQVAVIPGDAEPALLAPPAHDPPQPPWQCQVRFAPPPRAPSSAS